jgi:pimeloyl-ACP methyl ester carboxylesterase
MFRLILFLFISHTILAQTKQPMMFRWQDKHARKHLKKYIAHDTLIKTSAAVLHISYNTKPGKPYLLMLHGMGANARTNWSSQIGPLSEQFNLILPDLIYFGESTSASNNYSVEFQVEQIHEALLSLGMSESLDVMGFSYGGLVAATYNGLYREQVKKLVIIDGPVKFFSSRMADSLAKSVGIDRINNLIAPTTPAEFDGMLKAVISSTAFPATKRLKRKIIRFFFTPTKAIRDRQMDYLAQHETYYQGYDYKLDKTETLLIWGEKDGVIPVSVGKALHAAYPQTTRLLLFPRAKHDAHFKERKALNVSVIDFLTRQ